MKFSQIQNNFSFLKLSRWMAYLCAFGLPWSNASFYWGFYLALIFYILSFQFLKDWRILLKLPLVLLSLTLFIFISFKTVFSSATLNYAWFDFQHYRKLLAVILFSLIFQNLNQCRYLFISLLVGIGVLMLPTLLDGFGINNIITLSDYIRPNTAYGPGDLTYWRMHIQHGFHVAILFSSLMLGALYYPIYRPWFLLGALLCAVDILFFIHGRMALLSLALSLGVIVFFYLKSKKIFLIWLTILTLFFTALFVSVHSIHDRISSIYQEASLYYLKNNEETSGGNRLHYWNKSIEQFLISPIFGNGSGSFKQDLIVHHDPILTRESVHSHTHNEYLTQLSQYGITGLFLFLSLILMALTESTRFRDPWISKSIFLSTFIFSINAMTDSSLHNDWEGWTFILILSVISIHQKLKIKSKG